tara:strand:+ start:174 stop:1148 length:975 start_codon:yes stop_codon:yes gene_type:complete
MKNHTIVVLLISLASCTDSYWSDGITTEINLPNHVSQISATVIIEQGAIGFSALVSASSSLDSETGPDVIEDAVISVMSGDNTLYNLDSNHFDSRSLLYNSSLISIASIPNNIPNGQIDLIVSSSNYEEVYASSYMPEKPNPVINYIAEVEVDSLYEGSLLEITDQIEISLLNNLELDESYLIQINAFFLDVPSQEIEQRNLNIFSQDPRVRELNINSNYSDTDDEYNGRYSLISDETVSNISNGLENITFFITRDEKPGYYEFQYMICRISSLSPSLAEHYNSVDSYLNQSGSPFAEPDLMYSNISSGFGCFGMMNTYKEQLN